MNKRKRIFITGATSGVGLLLAKQLSCAGHEVWATGRNANALAELSKLGIQTIQADLTEEQDLESILRDVGSPDVVVLSAGVGTFSYITELELQDIEQMMDVNVVAPMLLTKYFATKMKEKRSGHILFVASQAGKVATSKASVYAASKHAIIGFANAARMELKEYGIIVTTINPGPIDTPFLDLADETGNYRDKMKKHLLSPEKVASAIAKAIERPVREIDLPFYMNFTSKLYAVFPRAVETLGKGFFNKK
ncbi:SDR family NAD(P)-dependent oxidoreductase [Psychrobacillus sp.]|uniref:SDR family NAD(P)-dependent oxidoreductase n=1 Tax=Psychrobacillus sp. TaxID=1871623 RepID=UPI0028BF1556|nr:SDR family NAD(P)-dependent oxidoreductase [Psychrobacillus sp.]